jgi:hypothetical protein
MNNQDWKRLAQALLVAFPTLPDLARMVQHGLGENLAEITLGPSLSVQVHDLIRWASTHERIPALLEAALADNPTNVALQALAADWELAPPAATGLPGEADRLFLCGPQLREARHDLNLSVSQWIEVLGYHSMQQWQLLEADQAEASESLLQRVSAVSGIALPWLKHRSRPKYPTLPFPYFGDAAISHLHRLGATDVYLWTDPEYSNVLLAARCAPYRWVICDLVSGLNFWEWDDSLGYIPYLYDLIRRINTQSWYWNSSAIYPKKIIAALSAGEIYAGKVLHLRSSLRQRVRERGWASAIYRLDESERPVYWERRHHGSTFFRVQQAFREYRDQNPEAWAQAATGRFPDHPPPTPFFEEVSDIAGEET